MKVKPSPSLKELGVLFVEDAEDARTALAMMLERYVGELRLASDGEEGLRVFSEQKPDIVITDLRMPRLDGITMLRRIKKEDPGVRTVIVTAFGEADYLYQALDLGVDAYLLKPIVRDRLFEKLNLLGDALQAQRQEAVYRELVHSILNQLEDALAVASKDGEIILANLAFARLDLDFSPGSPLHEQLKGLVARTESADREGGGQEVRTVMRWNHRIMEVTLKKIPPYYLVVLEDVTPFYQEIAKLREETCCDPLTRLYNRKAVEQVLEGLREPRLMCLVVGDIDDFKRINDRYGHNVGDEVLRQVAEIMRANLRRSDLVVRWGGEEFLVVLEDFEAEKGLRIAEKLRRLIEEHEFPVVGRVTLSFGVASGLVKGTGDFLRLFEAADQALYRAKAQGKNQVVVAGQGCSRPDGSGEGC